MSYEGREQNICENGHLTETDCYSYTDVCYICCAKIAWQNAIDDTNCDEVGKIHDFSSLLIEQEEVQTCNMGHQHITKHAKYRIPTEEETRKLRSY